MALIGDVFSGLISARGDAPSQAADLQGAEADLGFGNFGATAAPKEEGLNEDGFGDFGTFQETPAAEEAPKA